MTRPVRVPARSSRAAITQFSMIDAILAGDYEGGFPAAEVAAAGTHGIGCGQALDGELVVLDGRMLRCRADGSVTDVDPAEGLPFAEVCPFAPTGELPVASASRADVEALFLDAIPSRNLFYAIRLDGTFDEVEVREPRRQERPFRPFGAVAREQHEDELDATTGSIIGFWAPEVFQGVSVAGLHLHFVNAARTRGGHVLDYRVRSGVLRVEAYTGIDLRLPVDQAFLDARFTTEGADAAVRAVEGGGADRHPSSPRVELRPATAGDAAEIARIWQEGWADAHVGNVPAELIAARTPESFVSRARDLVPHTTVATRDGAVAGFVIVDADQVDHLYLARAARGAGMGAALLRAGEQAVTAAGHPRAWLAVATGNTAARRFYERLGWIDDGPFFHAAPVPGGTVAVDCHRFLSP